MSGSKKWIQIWIALICGNLYSKIAYFWMDARDKLLIRSVFSVKKQARKASSNRVGWSEAVNEMKKFERRVSCQKEHLASN